MNNQCQRISEENSVDTNFECITEVGDLKADRSLDEDDASQYVIISGSVDSCRTDDWSVFSLSSAGFKEEPSDFNSRTIPSASRDIDSNETGADIRRHASAENFEKVRNLDTINALSRKHHSYDTGVDACVSGGGKESSKRLLYGGLFGAESNSCHLHSSDSSSNLPSDVSSLGSTSHPRLFCGTEVNSKYDADEESFEGEKTLTEDQLRPPRNAAQSNSRCDQKHKKIFQGTSNGLVPIVSPLSICSRSLCLELHRDVFENNLEKLDEVWRKNKRKLNAALEFFDINGLNAMHLACRLGRVEYLDLFLVLANTHFFKYRTRDANALGWTVLDEAVILGNRKYIKLVYLMLQYHQQKRLKERELTIRKSLAQTIDFSLTIKWLFRSWIPLLSRYLPSDTCIFYKKGNCVRLDSTLLNFAQNSWKRGKITVLYNPTKFGGENFVFIVPAQKQYSISSIDKPLKPNELSREVNSLLSNDVIVTKVSTRNIQYTPVRRLISRSRKVDRIGKYSATFYHWSGMVLKIYKRRDHLTAEQVHKNKHVLSDFYTGGVIPGISGDMEARSRVADLKPPEDADGTFEEYLAGDCVVGRPMKVKSQSKHFKGSLAMSDQFPLTIEKLCEILELFSSFRLFNKLRTFLQRGMPPGFPVYIEMPIFPTVQGQVTMEDFQFNLPQFAQEDSFYDVPPGFEKVDDLEVT